MHISYTHIWIYFIVSQILDIGPNFFSTTTFTLICDLEVKAIDLEISYLSMGCSWLKFLKDYTLATHFCPKTLE